MVIGLLIMGMPLISTGTPVERDSAEVMLKETLQRAEKAGLSTTDLKSLVQRSRQKGLTTKEISGLIRPAAELAEQNLPGEMIIQKAFEGLAKGIPTARIQPVLLNLKSRIQQAKQVVDPWMEKNGRDGEKDYITKKGNERSVRFLLIEATATALSGNVTEDQITGLLQNMSENNEKRTINPRTLATSIQILPDLITTEEDPALSLKLLANAIDAGFTASDLNQLPQAMILAKQNSRLPARAVAAGFTRQLESGLAAGQIIQNLQVGNVKGGKMPPNMKNDKPMGPEQDGGVTDKKKNGGGK